MAALSKIYDDRLHNDWAWLKRFEDDNANTPSPAPGEKRVVFLGNSITENWIRIRTLTFLKDVILTAVSAAKQRHKCWCVSARM